MRDLGFSPLVAPDHFFPHLISQEKQYLWVKNEENHIQSHKLSTGCTNATKFENWNHKEFVEISWATYYDQPRSNQKQILAKFLSGLKFLKFFLQCVGRGQKWKLLGELIFSSHGLDHKKGSPLPRKGWVLVKKYVLVLPTWKKNSWNKLCFWPFLATFWRLTKMLHIMGTKIVSEYELNPRQKYFWRVVNYILFFEHTFTEMTLEKVPWKK